jgi:L-ascorbate metabolism protein UlaG (beta-lactamase superfamily)
MKMTRSQFLRLLGRMAVAFGITLPAFAAEPHASETSVKRKGKIRIEWLGHGSFKFTSVNGRVILMDPWLKTNPVCPNRYKEKRGFQRVDLILWTHGHVDHFMLPDAIALINDYSPKIISPWELSFFIKGEIPAADTQTFYLANKGATANFDSIKITMVEAYHSAGAQLTGFTGNNKFVGEAVGYIIEFENGFKVYHAGDTSLMGDMKYIIGDYYSPDLAILPIGGVFTMGPREAAYACKLIRSRYVIPEHYATFPVLTQNADEFVREAKRYQPGIETLVLKPGEEIKI